MAEKSEKEQGVQQEKQKEGISDNELIVLISEKAKDIREWWFGHVWDDKKEYEELEVKDKIKVYYGFLQIYHHDIFRASSSELEQIIMALINYIEKNEEFKGCGEKEERLKDLVLGAAYRRLGQFKIEHYQNNADVEYKKANYYLEKDTSFLNFTVPVDEEDFIISLLFLLNKAKYFRDIGENGIMDMEVRYWRAMSLFREIIYRIETKYPKKEQSDETEKMNGVIARIYINAQLNIVRMYRLLQDDEKTEEECRNLVCLCIESVKLSLGKDKEGKIDEIVGSISKLLEVDNNNLNGYMVEIYQMDWKNSAELMFEDYILQALVQLGISYRDSIDFNGSKNGKRKIKETIRIFLSLGILDRIVVPGGSEEQNEGCVKRIGEAIKSLDKLEFNVEKKEEKEELQKFVKHIKKLCTDKAYTESGKEKNPIKNYDAKNNLAVCLKKLKYFTEAIEILDYLKDKEENRFAEYNLHKTYLEAGAVKLLEIVRDYCCKEQQTNNRMPYVDIKHFDKSNHKWLFQYARYLAAIGSYESAEKLFHYISRYKPIRWNSIELKAAYLEAKCLIKRDKYLLAMDILEFIHDSLLKLNMEKSKKRLEIRTEINLGWCLIKCNRYDDAFKVYRDLVIYLIGNEGAPQEDTYEHVENVNYVEQGENGKKSIVELLEKLKTKLQEEQQSGRETKSVYIARWDDIDSKHQMRILHNLYNCLFLGRAESYEQIKASDTVQGSIKENNTKSIKDIICEICKRYEEKDEWLSFLEKLQILQNKDMQKFPLEEWKKLSEDFEGIVKKHSENIMVYSCWAISNVNYCLRLYRDTNDLKSLYNNKIKLLSGLVSSATPITMRAYIEIAKIILEENFLEIMKKDQSGQEENLKEMDKSFIKNLEYSFLESFCGVELLENGTNRAFINLMKNDEICSIKITVRAKLLALILELYGYILQVKKQFRVTYKNLEAYKKDPKDKEEAEPLIYQYTKLSTLKNILLPQKNFDYVFEEETERQRDKNSPKLRLSNVARMNDASEGSMFKEIFEKVIEKDKINQDKGQLKENQDDEELKEIQEKEKLKRIINTYIDNMFDFRNKSRLSVQDSNVYIGCFSMNKYNFGLWSNYADDEKGCVMGFDQSFFDFVDNNDNFMLDDEAEENALYRVVYVDVDSFSEKLDLQADENGDVGQELKRHEEGEFKKGDVSVIRNCIPGIFGTLREIDDLLEKFNEILYLDELDRKKEVVHVFIADRLNEIRFLFKSKSYMYEEELRIIRCSQDPEVDNTDAYPIPRLYVNVEKEIEKLTLVIGSRVEQQQFKELSVWAKNTKRVKQVIWSDLNRLK